MTWKSGRRRRDDELPADFGPAEPLVARDRNKFPYSKAVIGRRFDSVASPWLAIVNARGPWGTWRHLEANPPYIPMCLSLWKKTWWLEASAEQRNFCLEIWRIAAMEDWWGIFWGDPGQLWRRMGLDAATFAARLEWMLRQDLAVYLTDEERAAAIAIRAVGDDAPDSKSREEERGRGGDKEGERESRGEQRAEQSRAESRALPPKAAEAEDRARKEQSGSAPASRSATESEQSRTEARGQSRAQDRPEHSTDARASQGQARVQGTEAQEPVRVIGNASPPGSIRLDPPRSDGRSRPAPEAHSSVNGPPARRGEPSLLAKSLPMTLRAAGDPLKYAWLADVYKRLRFPYPMDSHLGRQELGSFESLYEEVQGSSLGRQLKMELLASDLDEADKIARKATRAGRVKRRGALFCQIHNSRMATYLARDGPGR